MSLHAPSLRRHRWLLVGVLACVLAAQWLALAHRVLHPHAPTVLTAEGHAAPAAGWTEKAFAGHAAGSLACQLLDQLAHQAPPTEVVALPLPALPTPVVAAPSVQAAPTLRRATYRARAPPSLT